MKQITPCLHPPRAISAAPVLEASRSIMRSALYSSLHEFQSMPAYLLLQNDAQIPTTLSFARFAPMLITRTLLDAANSQATVVQ